MSSCLESASSSKQKSLKRVRPPPRRKLGCSFAAIILISLSVISVYCIDFVHCGQPSPSAVSGLGKGGTSSSGVKDSSSRAATGSSSSSAIDDSEGSNHHHHNYHRHHRHSPYSASGKSQPHSSSSSSYPSMSTYNTYPDYSSPLSFSNPDSYYEPRFYERPSREFSARSTNYPALAAASTSQVGFADTEYGGLALATGHGGGHHAHGHQHGHQHGNSDGYGQGHTTYYKTVNKIDQSSLGLLGLLGLLSLLSNVLMLLTTTARTTTAAMSLKRTDETLYRKKRDTVMLLKMADDHDEHELARRSVVGHLSHLILPSLNVIGHAKDGRIPLNCTYQEICKTNKVLVQVFGVDEGRPVASVMSTAITKLLANKERVKSKSKRYNALKNGAGAPLVFIEKLLAEAGLAGRNGKDCEIAYPTCAALRAQEDVDDERYMKDGTKRRGPLQLPLLISPERASAIILGQQS